MVMVDASKPTSASQIATLPITIGGGTPLAQTNSVSVTLTPGVAVSLIYTDSQGLPTILDFRANAVAQTTTIEFVPELMTSPWAYFISGGHDFVLFACLDGVLDKGFAFSAPATVTIHYGDALGAVADESLFSLYWWSGNDWRNAAGTCVPSSSYVQDETNNTITTAICYPGQFGLFAAHRIYLPLIARAASW